MDINKIIVALENEAKGKPETLKRKFDRLYANSGMFHLFFFGPIFILMTAMIFSVNGQKNPNATPENSLCYGMDVVDCSFRVAQAIYVIFKHVFLLIFG